MAGSDGSKLVIFVVPAAHSRELSLSFVIVRSGCTWQRLRVRPQVCSGLGRRLRGGPVCVTRLAFAICAASTAFPPVGSGRQRRPSAGMPADECASLIWPHLEV